MTRSERKIRGARVAPGEHNGGRPGVGFQSLLPAAPPETRDWTVNERSFHESGYQGKPHPTRIERRDADRLAHRQAVDRVALKPDRCDSCGHTQPIVRYIYSSTGPTRLCGPCADETAID